MRVSDALSRLRGTLCHYLARWGRALVLAVPGVAVAAPPVPAHIADGIYVVRGAGGEIDAANGGRVANVGFVVGPRGVVVIDTGISYGEGEDVATAVASVSDLPIRLAVLTHPRQEAIFGAAALQDRGASVLAHADAAALIANRCEGCLARLRGLLGAEIMASTRVVTPDRIVTGDERIDAIGRPLQVIAPPGPGASGMIAVFDRSTSTLFAGALVPVHRVPDLSDTDSATWRAALPALRATHCRRLVPAYGPVGSCRDIAAVAAYLDALERRVTALLREGVGLIDVPGRSGLREFETWDGYATLHAANASRTYLRLEQKLFQ